MNKQQLHGLIGILSLILFSSFHKLQEPKQPNILFIAIDDLKPTIGAYGNEVIHSPYMDEIARKGTTFMNHHCQQAVCSPSRVSLLTGQYPDQTKIWDLKTQLRTTLPYAVTLPQHFKNNGYHTAGIGKIFHGSHDYDSISWNNYLFVEKEDYENEPPIFGHYQNKNTVKKLKQYANESTSKRPRLEALMKLRPAFEQENVPDDAYEDGQIAKKSATLIESFSKDEKPFFLAVGFKKPHLPFVAPKKYWDLYKRKNIPLTPNPNRVINGHFVSLHSMGEISRYTDANGNLPYTQLGHQPMSNDKQRELIHAYYACVSYIDAQIGLLIETLKATNQYDNTVIVIWGDHGWHLGDHGLWCKHTNFEQATRSPLIIQSPNLLPSKTTTPTGHIDLYPTLCDIAHIEPPKSISGKSLLPIMKDTTLKRTYTVSQYPRGVNLMGYAIRSEHYRYVCWKRVNYRTDIDYLTIPTFEEEFYDYQTYPYESINLMTDSSYQSAIDSHKVMLTQFFEKLETF